MAARLPRLVSGDARDLNPDLGTGTGSLVPCGTVGGGYPESQGPELTPGILLVSLCVEKPMAVWGLTWDITPFLNSLPHS